MYSLYIHLTRRPSLVNTVASVLEMGAGKYKEDYMSTLFLGFYYAITVYATLVFARWVFFTPGWIRSELARIDSEYLEQVDLCARSYFEIWHKQWLFEQHVKFAPTLHSPQEIWEKPELVASPKRGARPWMVQYGEEEYFVFSHSIRRCLDVAGLAPREGWAILTAIRR